MRYIPVLAKHAAEIAAGEEYGARAVVALDTGFFAEVRSECVYGAGGGGDKAPACFFVAVCGAEAWAEVAVLEVVVGEGEFAGDVVGGEGEVAGGVVIEEERWGEVEMALAVGDDGGFVEGGGDPWGEAKTVRHGSHSEGRRPLLVWR